MTMITDTDDRRPSVRRRWWRRLDLNHNGRTFLRRRGLDNWKAFGIVVHRLDAPDPGMDLHDHPWSFVTFILNGGYTEQWANIAETDEHRYEPGTWGAWLFDDEPDDSGELAADLPLAQRAAMESTLRNKAGGTLPHERPRRYLTDDDGPVLPWANPQRTWRRWSIHKMPLDVAHRITACEPNTITLVLRTRKVRRWGFYQPDGWVDWEQYDYATRRACTVESDRPEERR